MRYQHILITGGAGFVGSNIAIKLKEKYSNITITVIDNFIRKGSELNIPRLKAHGITLIKGDIRNRDELFAVGSIDLIIECAAEPSVLAGIDESPAYLIDTNLGGAINCLELARIYSADFIFLSTSRVYPVEEINRLSYGENKTRFFLTDEQKIPGVSSLGISENFPLGDTRTLYGATKLSAEFMAREYAKNYGIHTVLNRCGVIAGPWQFGKVDQGVMVLWVARHIFKKPLSYIGYGGKGKQVRDFIHIDDLFEALSFQIENIEQVSGKTFNIGGGVKNSFSLLELTTICEKMTGNKIFITKEPNERPGDLKLYISDYRKFSNLSGWKPVKDLKATIEDIYKWINENKKTLKDILG